MYMDTHVHGLRIGCHVIKHTSCVLIKANSFYLQGTTVLSIDSKLSTYGFE